MKLSNALIVLFVAVCSAVVLGLTIEPAAANPHHVDTPAVASSVWVAHAAALERYGVSIGDPNASLTGTAIQAEADHLRVIWCPFAAGKTTQQLADYLDPDGSPEHIRWANESSMIAWNGWCTP
jgi:hypothetical protein